MAFSYRGSSSAAVTGAAELDSTRPAGVQAGDVIIAVYAFEGVAAGSGPWIVPNIGQLANTYIGPGQGWQQVCWQSPAAAGVGIEVWAAIHGTGGIQDAIFVASQNAVTVSVAYGGEYNPTGVIGGGPIRDSTTAQVTGNQPAAPSVAVNAGDLIVACAGDLMGAGGFGSPSGFTNRVDVARAGAGTVEAAIADATAAVAAPSGLITFPNAAAASSTRGTTATLAIIAAPTVAGVGPILDVPFPEELDLGDGWTLRVTALDPVTGAVVPGVTVSNFALEVELGAGTNAGDLATGDYKLVPGPGA